MKTKSVALAISLLAMASSPLSALPFADDEITAFDGRFTPGGNPRGCAQNYYCIQEDREVEPGNAQGQHWDLEGVFTHGSKGEFVSIIGGFDFLNGEAAPDANGNTVVYRSGDIFIDIDGDFNTNQPNVVGDSFGESQSNGFGLDYVLDLNFDTLTYDILALTTTSQLEAPYWDFNYTSGPVRYISGGTAVSDGNGGFLMGLSFSYASGLTDAQTGFDGEGTDNHYAIYGFDLSFLRNRDFDVRFSQTCGNDLIVGHHTVAEPATVLTLVMSLTGLLGLRRFHVASV